MKNTTLVLGFALLGYIPVASAQESSHHKMHHTATAIVTPPPSVDSAFQAKYGGSAATWIMTPGGNYTGLLDTTSGKKEYVEFTADGQWIRTRTEMTMDQLPDSARQALQTKFPGMAVMGVEKMEYLNVNPFYKVDFKDGDSTKSVVVNDAGFIDED